MADPTSPSLSAPIAARPRRYLLGITIPLLAGAIALAAGWALLDASTAQAAPTAMRAASASHPFVQLKTLALHDQPVIAPAPPVPTWSISIATVGMQAEIDACQWVRMDFTAEVVLPVVAAHNFCGGGIVLDMQGGDTVALAGTGLDGLYVVVAAQDAWADSDAADAISGLAGDVVLQTCYWTDDGQERLVGLQKVG